MSPPPLDMLRMLVITFFCVIQSQDRPNPTYINMYTGFAAEEHGFTEVESVLPWKRDDEKDVCHRPLKWHNTSAPAWIANDNYSSFVSPPASVIGGEIYNNIRIFYIIK